MVEESKAKLPKAVFGAEVSPALLAQSARVYLANQRKAHAKTKTRAEVEGSTRKIYKQKGTGKARHGSIRAPIFVGGGISHGPTGGQNYKLTMSSKMGRLATMGALSAKAKAGEITVLSGAEKASGKTSQVVKMVKPGALVVSLIDLTKFNQAVRNIEGVRIAYANSLNAYQVMAHKMLVIAEPALQVLEKKYATAN